MRLQRGKVFWKGSVRIRVTGREPERFFNLCGHHNITLWDVTEHQGCFEMSLLPEDFSASCRSAARAVCASEYRKTGTAFLLPAKFKKKGIFYWYFSLPGGTLHAVAVHLEYSCGRKLREQYADDLKQP